MAGRSTRRSASVSRSSARSRCTSKSGSCRTLASPSLQHSPNAKAFREIAANTWAGLIAGKGAAAEPPKLEVAGDKSYLKVSFVGGVSYELSAEMLRVMSPSAEVQGHSPSQRVTVGKKRNVKIKDLRSVGNYAVRIVFDDGHDTGLYSWTYLEELGREKDPRWALYLAELKQKGLSRE